ncbi:MAG: cyclopropane-fatty-acyl-phospholipid synthase family protein [Candidatus Nanohalobium sp.]
MDSEDINDLYDSTAFDYEFFWSNDTMHYGFDSYINSTAIENSNQHYQDRLDISPEDKVLVVGCGKGGFSNFLAENTDAEIYGLDLNNRHIRKARKMSRNKGTEDSTEFLQGDFHNLPFDSESFDSIAAIETVSHSDSKEDFLKEAYRVLNDEGNILVSDGWLTGETYDLENPEVQDYSLKDQKQIEDVLEGWALPEGRNYEEFEEMMRDTGFTEIDMVDHWDRIKPSAEKMRALGLIGVPMMKAAKKLGLRNEWSVKQARTLRSQYPVFKEDKGIHADFLAEK